MKKKITDPSETSILRQKAEILLKEKLAETDSLHQESDYLKLIFELQVHQIELEMQKEELNRAKELAEAAAKKAEALFDFAPIGYFKITPNGEIIELNFAGAIMLGMDRKNLMNKQFCHFVTSDTRQIYNHFLNIVFESEIKQSCEIEVSSNGISTFIYLSGVVDENRECCFLTGVEITLRKHLEVALQENNSRLELAMQGANIAWWEMDISKGLITFGEKKAEMLGFLPEKFKHYKDFTELIHPDDYDKAMNAMRAHIKGEKEKYEVEYRILTRSGEYKWFYDIGSIVKRSTEGIPLKVTGLVFDITERKLAENNLRRSEETYRMLVENSGTSIIIINSDGKYLMANEKAASEMGYAPKEIIGKSMFDFLPEPVAKKYLEINNSLIASCGRREYEDEFMLNGKRKVFFIIDQCLKDEHGNHFAIQSSSIDITERKHAEEEMKISEERYRLVLENSMDAILFSEPGGKIFDANPAACAMFDRTEDEIIKIGRNGLLDSTDPRLNILLEERNRTGKFHGEITMIRKDGSKFPAELSTSVFPDHTNEEKTSLIIRDISERKVAEEAIKRSEALLRIFVEHTPAAIAMFDLDMKYIVTSKRFLIDYDIQETNIIGRTHYEVFPDIPQRWKDIHQRCLSGSTERCEEDPFPRKSGKLDWIKWEICPWYETEEKIGGIILFSEVITERKLAEDRLITSMQLTKNIIDNSPSLFYLVDLEGKFILTNQKLKAILEKSDENLIGNTRESFLPKGIADQHRINDLAVIESGQALTFEEENMEPDGKHFYMTQKFPLVNSEGKVYAVGGISTDMTEKKKAVESLKISEAKWRNLFEILPVGVSIIDNRNKVTDFNPALGQILDISAEGLLMGDYSKRTYFRTDLTPMSREEFPSVRSVNENKIIRNVKIGVQKEDQSIVWTSVSSAPLPGINSTVTVTTDITEQKKVEEKLIKSEEQWKSLVFNTPDYIAVHDKEGFILFMNHYAQSYSEKDVLGKSLFDFVSQDSTEIFKDAFEKCKIEMKKQDVEFSAVGDYRELRMYESSLVPFLVENNEINVLVVSRDITQRMKTDQEVRKSREQLVQLNKHLNVVREEERTSIAREIHDDLGQSLAGLKMDLIGMKDDRNKKVLSNQKVDKAILLVDSTIKTIQRITSQLRPQMLDELGLAAAIEWQSNEFKKRTGIICRLKLEDIDDLADNIAISLFRIFQASLTNIMLHSKAKSMSVILGIKDEMIQLLVSDDGIGISQEQLNSAKSFGIISMRERVNQIYGKIEFRTKENKGTEISATIPLERKRIVENK